MDPLKFSDDFIYKTGERIIPGSVSQDALSEHYTRYFFAQDFCQGKRVLNVACGAGYGSEVLLQTASEVFNVDISEQLVAYGNLKYGNYKNHFITMNAQKMAFPDNFFDVIVSFETFEHLPKYSLFLHECQRLLKKSGTLILSMPNKNITSPGLDKPLNRFHFKEWTVSEFDKVIHGIFKIDKLLGQNFTQPHKNSNFLSWRLIRELSNLLYIHLPSFFVKYIKTYVLNYQEVPLKRVKLYSKDSLKIAKSSDFSLNKDGLSYAIMVLVLKKLSK